MVMNVHYCLSAVCSAVIDNSKSGLKTLDLCNFVYSLDDFAHILRTLFGVSHITDVIEMLLRYDKSVYRSYGLYIVEAVYIVVLVNLRRRDLTFDNVTE